MGGYKLGSLTSLLSLTTDLTKTVFLPRPASAYSTIDKGQGHQHYFSDRRPLSLRNQCHSSPQDLGLANCSQGHSEPMAVFVSSVSRTQPYWLTSLCLQMQRLCGPEGLTPNVLPVGSLQAPHTDPSSATVMLARKLT